MTREATRIFIVADTRLYREGVADALARTATVNVVGLGTTEPAVVPRIVELAPDVILLDIGAPWSYALAAELQRAAPDIPIVALGINNSEGELLRCAEAGIVGWITEEAPLIDLVPVIEGAARGEAICSPRFARTLVRKLSALAVDRQPDRPPVRLTDREREIVALLEQDLSNKEIASRLSVEVTTVKNHVHNLLEKLSVSRRSEIVTTLNQNRRTGLAAPHRNHRGREI